MVLEFTWQSIKIDVIVGPVTSQNGKVKVDYEAQTFSQTRLHNCFNSHDFNGSKPIFQRKGSNSDFFITHNLCSNLRLF